MSGIIPLHISCYGQHELYWVGMYGKRVRKKEKIGPGLI
ncbi:MAG: hypothetical protein C5S38_02640 [Candidatus Methanophagaceae archaeon]|nr:MAG: hypothetical protein C5S38_02640 [Methanophagales archaeon]